MSALEDVQRSLNAIRALSTEENAKTQQQILELMLQASISQLKSIDTAPKAKTAAAKPATLPIPKPTKPTAPKPKPQAVQQPSWEQRRNKLKVVQPQAPRS